jgi:hypothetical protein
MDLMAGVTLLEEVIREFGPRAELGDDLAFQFRRRPDQVGHVELSIFWAENSEWELLKEMEAERPEEMKAWVKSVIQSLNRAAAEGMTEVAIPRPSGMPPKGSGPSSVAA